MKTIDTIDTSPFKKLVMTIGELPTTFIDSMSYYEALAWLVDYIQKTVIPAVNNNAEAVEELQKLFVELKSFVDNYFENLDVQEEIDNKLDEMAESGQLAEIIAQFLGLKSVYGFNTIADMAVSEYLNEGSICKTLGQTNVDAGDGSYYLVRQRTNDDNPDGVNVVVLTNTVNLVAELIPDYSNTITSQSTLTLQRKCRWFNRSKKHPEHVSGQDYPWLQGGTYVGSGHYVIVRNRDDDNSLLEEVTSSGSIVRSVAVNVGHGNSVTYNPTTGKLYIAGLKDSISQLHNVYVFDYTTFTAESTITFADLTAQEGTLAVSYDLVEDKYYLVTETLPTNSLKVYEWDITDNSLTYINLPDPTGFMSVTNTNDALVYDNILYIMKHEPQMLLTYNLVTKKLIKVYNIKNTTGFGYRVGELQNISIIYDAEPMNLAILTNKPDCENGFYYMIQLFEANTETCTPESYPIGNEPIGTLWVDSSSTDINPNGTSAHKFKYINEAIDVALSRDDIGEIYVTPGTYPYVNIPFNSRRFSIGKQGEGTVTIQGFRSIASGYIYLYNMTIANESADQNYDMSLDTGDYRLSGIVCSGSNQTQHIYLHNTNLEFYNVTNAIFQCGAENTINCYDKVPSYKYYGSKNTKLMQPVKVGTFLNVTNIDGTEINVPKEMLDRDTILKIHGYWSYTTIRYPSLNTDGTRITPTYLYQKGINFSQTYNATTEIATLKLEKVLNMATGGITDQTTSTTINDVEMWVI